MSITSEITRITGNIEDAYTEAAAKGATMPATQNSANLAATIRSIYVGGVTLLDVYPVGSIYMSVNSTSPATLFGGTWQRIQDTFLLAAGTNHAAGSTGGEETHTLIADEIPAHTHGSKTITGEAKSVMTDAVTSTPSTSGALSFTSGQRTRDYSGSSGNGLRGIKFNSTHTHDSVGGGQAHNNMPPYLAVYVWQRTA